MEDKVISPEKAEEAKLKARYPHLGQKPGGSDFLRKRLQKGVSNLELYSKERKPLNLSAPVDANSPVWWFGFL